MLIRLHRFRRNLAAIWFAVRHPGTPRWIKGALLAIALYVVSPVDLIPDVIPLAGWLDDALLVPFGIGFLLKFVPEEVTREATAASARPGDPTGRGLKWLLLGLLLVWGLLIAWALRQP
ncbi:YkvA family protein [Pantoea sp. 1.19]|uniref:YkvA family protein n=1 Tax=Pantoea sp. 1.19 TaxID=1925589 RepID=UPI000948D3BA|nr:YkvA family protein [Pantoea sp. 1.19]